MTARPSLLLIFTHETSQIAKLRKWKFSKALRSGGFVFVCVFFSQLSEIKRRSCERKTNCCCSSKHCLPRNWNRQKSSIICLRGKRYFGGLFAFQCLYFLETNKQTNKHRRRVNQSSGRMNLSAKQWLLLGSFYVSSLLIRDCITTKLFRFQIVCRLWSRIQSNVLLSMHWWMPSLSMHWWKPNNDIQTPSSQDHKITRMRRSW